LISTGRLARALALALLLGGPLAPAYSLEPVARLKGPVNAQVDVEFWLKFAGSVGDDPVELELASGPEPVNLALLYDRDGKPVYGIASVGQAGVYQFVVVATGKPEGAKKAKRAYAFWTIHVGGPQPVPPGPTPVPPGPNPTPVPPDPGSGLASYIRDIVARAVPAADRASGALSIAAVYREAVRLGRDGKFPNPQTMVTFVKEGMRTARPASWAGFVLEPKLKALRLATTEDHVKAFEEISATLEAIARGE
jgi:hypothetical protein